jgi:hypothetical protein
MLKIFRVILFLIFLLPSASMADDKLIDNFELQPDARWRFIADTVMGGVSIGRVEFYREAAGSYARMTGTVSTKNNGGFIQFRTFLDSPLPKESKGLRLVVRGNQQNYFVHLRTNGIFFPWQFYQAKFEVSEDWSEVYLPFQEFKTSGFLLRSSPLAESIESIGVVAFGIDHEAKVDVLEVSFY